MHVRCRGTKKPPGKAKQRHVRTERCLSSRDGSSCSLGASCATCMLADMVRRRGPSAGQIMRRTRCVNRHEVHACMHGPVTVPLRGGLSRRHVPRRERRARSLAVLLSERESSLGSEGGVTAWRKLLTLLLTLLPLEEDSKPCVASGCATCACAGGRAEREGRAAGVPLSYTQVKKDMMSTHVGRRTLCGVVPGTQHPHSDQTARAPAG